MATSEMNAMHHATTSELIPWESLTQEQQIALRDRFGYYLDNLPPTCSLATKIARFQYWLEEQGVAYRDG
jgi:hypothetical protein